MRLASFLHAALGALLACSSAAWAAPAVVSISPGRTLVEYTGASPVGLGQVQQDGLLQYVEERTAGTLRSVFLFFDPSSLQSLQATLDFGGPIVQVFSTRAELAASHATWGVDIDGNLLADDYGSALAIGLEANDQLSWTPGQSLLSLAWTASHPGDHIRVLVGSVPEPTGLALALSALLALRASRRRDAGR
jgi:hypothetical protein